jgi:hypothetical protein
LFEQALPKLGAADFAMRRVPGLESMKHSGNRRPVQEEKWSFWGHEDIPTRKRLLAQACWRISEKLLEKGMPN